MKNIYKDFNNIEFDMNEIDSITIELDDITKNRIKKNLNASIKKRNYKYILKTIMISSAAAIMLFFSLVPKTSITAFAEKIPILNSLFQNFGNRYNGDFEEYSQVIGEVKKDKGYEVTVNEVVIDDFSLMLVYTVKSKETVTDLTNESAGLFPHSPNKTLKINGKYFNAGYGGSSLIIDDHTVQVFEDYNTDTMDIPQKFDLEIDFKDINNTKGTWKFNFAVSKEKISNNIKTYYPNNKMKITNNNGKKATLTFEKVSFSPISTAILIKSNKDFDYDQLVFKTENGSVIETNSKSLHGNYLGYTILYKFKSIKNIPSKIIVEDKKSNATAELILK